MPVTPDMHRCCDTGSEYIGWRGVPVAGGFASATSRRRGFFLIVVLIVVAVATMAVYSFTDLMQAYDQAAHLNASRAQADLLVESGAEMTRLLLSQPPEMRDQSGGVFSNPAQFQAVNVVPDTDPFLRGNFTIIAPNLDETGQLAGIRFGLQNESARLNLNVLPTLETSGEALTAVASLTPAVASELGAAEDPMASSNLAASLLMGLPGMTPDVAEAILDWLDEDDEPREFGAEAEYYSTLPSPYMPKNGPLDSVEELLLVRGVTPQLLFGLDANRNGVVDVSEQQFAVADVRSVSSLGWSAFLTIHSLEANKRADGSDRINVNSDDLEALYDELVTALGDETWASFIVAYRVGGQSSAAAGQGGSGVGADESEGPGEEDERDGGGGQRAGGGEQGGNRPPQPWTVEVMDQIDLSAGGSTQVGQLLDLVGATVTLGQGDDARSFTSPFAEEPLAMVLYMPALMGNLTTQDYDVMPGRININECPAELIRGIPMLDEETAEAIIEARAQQVQDDNRRYETWPLVEGIVSLEQMRTLMPILTGGGDVYRAQIVGYFEAGNIASRAEVIINATGVNPRVISFRDLSHLGRGFDTSVLGLRAADSFAPQ